MRPITSQGIRPLGDWLTGASDPWEIDSLHEESDPRGDWLIGAPDPRGDWLIGAPDPRGDRLIGAPDPGGEWLYGVSDPGESCFGRFIYIYTNNQNLKYFNTLVRGQVSLIYEKSWRLIISFDLLRRVRRRNSWDEAILWYFFQLHGFLKKNIINKFKGTVSHVVDAWDPVPTVVHEAHYPMYRSST